MRKVTASCLSWVTAGSLACLGGCGDAGGGSAQASSSQTTTEDATAGPSTEGEPTGVETLGGSTVATGAETGTAGSESTAGAPAPWPEHVAVTADWLEGTLTVIDLEAIADGATRRAEIEVRRVDLSSYAPGPLQLEWVDEARVLVAISPGFYDGIVGNTIGVSDVALDGTLLLVDLLQGVVVEEFATAHVPMGLAVNEEGTIAYSANYGHSDAPGDTLSIVDLDAGVVEDVVVGARPEQVSLSEDGTLGIVNLAGEGTVRVFQTADVAGTLSAPVETSADPSDVDFIAGTSLAVVANSLSPAVYTVLDVSDPSAPVVVHEAEPLGGFPYGITAVPGTTDFVMTVANQGAKFTRVNAADEPPTELWLTEIPRVASFPLGIAVADHIGAALVAAPGADAMVVLDLVDGASTLVEWEADPPTGPTYVAVRP